METNILRKRWDGYVIAVLGVAVVTALLAPFNDRLSSTTVALALLLVVLFSATYRGSGPALLASVLAMLCFNFFFFTPYYTFTIDDPQNWVALTAFLATAITAGQLSARAKRRAEEAEDGRRENKRLYEELHDAFERVSRAEAPYTITIPVIKGLSSRKHLVGPPGVLPAVAPTVLPS